MSIRKRLVFWHTVILAGFLLVFTIGLYFAFKFHLNAEVDGSLAAWAAQMDEPLNSQVPSFDRMSSLNSGHSFPQMNSLESFVMVLKANDSLIWDRLSLSRQSISQLRDDLKVSIAKLNYRANGIYRDVFLEGEYYRVYVKAISPTAGNKPDLLILGRSLMHVRTTLSGLALTLVLAWFVALMVCSVISWIFVGRTLYPVKMMTQDSLNIANSGELGRRIKDFGENDEFGQLSRALNRMLASLEVLYSARKKFLADASHELRTPLTSIMANLEFLQRATRASQNERNAALQDTIKETNRMAGLVNELLMLARAEAATSFLTERTDLAALVSEIVSSYQMHQQILKRTIQLKIARPVWVNGDPAKLREAIVILIDNAVKYSPDEGIIQVKLRSEANSALLEIADQGPGIPETELTMVFDRFYRATNIRNKSAGSGLGLAIAKSIFLHHDGHIELKNLIPSGLAATVTLPVIT